jgi:hypothetical protein
MRYFGDPLERVTYSYEPRGIGTGRKRSVVETATATQAPPVDVEGDAGQQDNISRTKALGG